MACGPIQTGGLVYAVFVSQPVQSWTVLRSHEDFLGVGDALSQLLSGLPRCPSLGDSAGTDLAAVVKARNELQQWLSAILMYPGARESPAVRNFLTFGANTIPPHYDGVAWTQFNTVLSPEPQLPAGGPANGNIPNSPHQSSYSTTENTAVADLEMEDMFFGDDEGAHLDEDTDYVDEEFIPAASVRYKPTDEAVTDEDMNIMQQLGEVEMVDDIGSLAQSMGASHVGRSLQLQAQLKYSVPGGNSQAISKPVVQGLNVGGASTQRAQQSGGIGSAMEQAESSGFTGVGDNFNQKPLQSAPRLDSFKMIKVIGKGSFGKWQDVSTLCKTMVRRKKSR